MKKSPEDIGQDYLDMEIVACWSPAKGNPEGSTDSLNLSEHPGEPSSQPRQQLS